jgi:hypothetical protein
MFLFGACQKSVHVALNDRRVVAKNLRCNQLVEWWSAEVEYFASDWIVPPTDSEQNDLL